MSDDELFRAFADPLRELGLELDDVELHGGVLQVTVARPAGDLDLDLLARASRTLSALLDEHDELAPPGRYELEVSSPGVERRLRRPEQFRRAIGENVSVRTQPGSPGERRAEGVLSGVDESGITLAHASGEERAIAFADIERARTVFDWQAELSASRAAERADKAAERAERRARSAERRGRPSAEAAGTEDETDDTDVARERAARS